MSKIIPYGKHFIDEDDVNAVVNATVANQDIPPMMAKAHNAICPESSNKHKKAKPLTKYTIAKIYLLWNISEKYPEQNTEIPLTALKTPKENAASEADMFSEIAQFIKWTEIDAVVMPQTKYPIESCHIGFELYAADQLSTHSGPFSSISESKLSDINISLSNSLGSFLRTIINNGTTKINPNSPIMIHANCQL